jgi:hypothetical protein
MVDQDSLKNKFKKSKKNLKNPEGQLDKQT